MTTPASANLPVLRFEGVTKRFGTQAAVDDLSLALEAGEILTLLGPSGCGKTTTLRMGIGLERADSGRIRFGDQLLDAPAERVFVAPERREMGMVFQSYAIWPHLSVFENVAYPLRARHRPEAEIRAAVDTVLAQVGLASFAERAGTKLSGGQQQRVAIARALVYGPGVLLMDEPFSNLDRTLREQMRAELKLLQRRLRIAVLFVTHDQEEALALSDRVAVMAAGRVAQIGTPRELYAAPATAAVRDFLGRTLLFPGRLGARDATGVHVALDEGPACVAGGPDRTAGAAPGTRCTLAIRPEQIDVSPADDDAVLPAHNALRGRLLALLFLGDRYEAEIGLASGRVVTALVSAAREWREGSEVVLGLPAAHLHVWPAP